MSHLIIGSEGDMEYALDYTIQIASNKVASKQIDISFSSENLMTIFMANLLDEFAADQISNDNGLHLSIHLPEN
tara:strand:+ start:288 stop:509 length:222 start_codon:yes stop_codon:yes gene_type:complete